MLEVVLLVNLNSVQYRGVFVRSTYSPNLSPNIGRPLFDDARVASS